jgi:hypothetical protein
MAQRHRRDVEHARELLLRGEPLTGLEHPGADRLADPPDDPLDRALHTDRCEDSLPGCACQRACHD